MFAPILFFDGDCSLCNRWVDFVLRNETSNNIHFASLQSPYCSSFFNEQNFTYNVDSLVYWDGTSFWTKSNAVIQLAKCLKRPFNLIWIASFIPTRWRDSMYDLIARNRKKFFRNASTCRIPTAGEKERFLSA